MCGCGVAFTKQQAHNNPQATIHLQSWSTRQEKTRAKTDTTRGFLFGGNLRERRKRATFCFSTSRGSQHKQGGAGVTEGSNFSHASLACRGETYIHTLGWDLPHACRPHCAHKASLRPSPTTAPPSPILSSCDTFVAPTHALTKQKAGAKQRGAMHERKPANTPIPCHYFQNTHFCHVLTSPPSRHFAGL